MGSDTGTLTTPEPFLNVDGIQIFKGLSGEHAGFRDIGFYMDAYCSYYALWDMVVIGMEYRKIVQSIRKKERSPSGCLVV